MKVFVPSTQRYMISDKCLIDDDEDEIDDAMDESAIAEIEYQKKREIAINEVKSLLDEKINAQESINAEISKLKKRLDELLQINL